MGQGAAGRPWHSATLHCQVLLNPATAHALTLCAINFGQFTISKKLTTGRMSRFKHKILKELLAVYNEKNHSGQNWTEEGKSLSTEDLQTKTELNLNTLDSYLRQLHYNDYIKKTKLVDKQNDFWYITDKGREALSDNKFLWYCNIDFLLKFGGLVISLLALLNSIFHFIDK
ncbi:MAG: hypothetical protein IT213_14710 [Cytophagales bacterium]|nr:hypothetical protein [Cytophagales bacterium]